MADVSSALRKLTEQAAGQSSRQDKTMPAAPALPAIPARVGSSGPVASPSARAGGGGGSLTETNYADRTFHAERTVLSSDGILAVKFKPVKTIQLTDAAGTVVTHEYKAKL